MSAPRVSAPKAQMFGFATQISISQVTRIVLPAAARCFSQTIRAAEEYATSNAEEGECPAANPPASDFYNYTCLKTKASRKWESADMFLQVSGPLL